MPGFAEPISCSLDVELEQDTDATIPEDFHVWGTARLNFTCNDVLGYVHDYGLPAVVTLAVDGFMTPGGQLLLGSLEPVSEGAVGIGIDGAGADSDGDGIMDLLDGNFVLSIDFPSYATLSLPGTFSTDRAN